MRLKFLAPPFALLVAAAPAFADLPFKKGEVLLLTAAVPLPDNAGKVTVVETGPESWFLVEYDRTFTKSGVSGMQTERAQMWVNAAQLIAAKRLAKE